MQVRFAAEFALFLVSLAGVGFTFLRADLLVVRPMARATSAVGFAALAAAALASGSLIVDTPTDPLVVALRFGGIVLLGSASLSWRPDRGGRELLRIGLVALVAAEVALAGDEASTLGDAARVIGALAIGACLLGASARVISARIAASSALVLLAVITVVAVALSAVISDNVEDEALRRYGARAVTEATTMEAEGRPLLGSAKLMATALGASANNPTIAALRRITDTSRDPAPEDQALVAGRIDLFVTEFVADLDPQRGPTLIVDREGQVVVVTPTPPDLGEYLLELAGHPAISQALEGERGSQTQAVVLVGGRLLVVAASPLVIEGTGFRGVIVRTSNLDGSFLQVRTTPITQEDAGVGLALVDRDGVLADSGTRVDPTVLRAMARTVLDAGDEIDRATDDRFIAARPVRGVQGEPVVALVLSAPRAQEDATREDLFRVLFVVAMGAAAVAMVLAGVTGERIGVGLRKLTSAAASIQAGNLNAHAGVTTEDELGELGDSFDAMAASLKDLTADLRTSVLDEAELRARLEAVFSGMGEALIAVDHDATITDFNTAAEEMFDFPAPRCWAGPSARSCSCARRRAPTSAAACAGRCSSRGPTPGRSASPEAATCRCRCPPARCGRRATRSSVPCSCSATSGASASWTG